MRLVIFNDPHYARNPPECRAASYPIEILEKLHEVARLAVKLNASAIGCSGDWFHRKGRVTFRESNDLLAVLNGWREKGLDVFGILGNHDVAGHSLESLDNRAVGSLVHSRVMQLLDHRPYWGHSQDAAVYVTGTSYFHGCDADDDSRALMYGSEPPEIRPHPKTKEPIPCVRVHVAHGTLRQRGTFFEDYTTAEDLIDLLYERGRLPDVIVSGHLHFDEGIRLYDRPDGKGQVAVARVGSLGRVASDDFDRTPNVLVIAAKGARFVCKSVPIGKPVVRGGETPTGARDTSAHEERIQEFVRVLREEADSRSLEDHGVLLSECCKKMGYGSDVLAVAREAVERRQ